MVLFGGVCVVLFGGACMVLFGGACVVLFGGVGMRGFIRGGACVVLFGGHAWFYSEGACVVLFGGACVVLFRGGVRGFFSFFGYNEIRSMSGRYASYWNAFLCSIGIFSCNS